MLTFLSQLKSNFYALPRSLRVTSYFIVAYLVYAMLLGLLVPQIASTMLPDTIKNTLGREAKIQAIRINPFTLRLQADQLDILGATGERFAGFGQFTATINLWHSVFNTAISLSDIHLSKPYAYVEAVQSTADMSLPLVFSFDDIVQHLAENTQMETQQQAQEESANLPHVLIDSVIVQTANLSLKLDKKHTGKTSLLTIDALNFKLDNLDSLATLNDALTAKKATKATQKVNQYQIDVTANSDSHLATSGTFQLMPMAIKGQVKLSKLSLSNLWPFIEELFVAKMTSGNLNIASEYNLTQQPNGWHVATNAGRLSIENLVFEHQQQPVVSLASFILADISVDNQAQLVNIGQALSHDLMVKAQVDDAGINLQKLFTPTLAHSNSTEIPPATADDQLMVEAAQTAAIEAKAHDKSKARTAAEAKIKPEEVTVAEPRIQGDTTPAIETPWQLVLGELSLENYDFSVSEQIVTKQAQTWRVYPLGLSTSSIHSDLKTPVEYQLDFGINEQGNVRSNGSVDLEQKAISSTLDVNQLELAQFQPYVAPIMNIDIQKGLLNTQSKIEANNQGLLQVETTIQLDDLHIQDSVLKQDLLKWQQLAINQIKFDQQQNSLLVDIVNLKAPYSRLVIAEDRSTNVGQLMVASNSTKTSSSSEQNKESTNATGKKNAVDTKAKKLNKEISTEPALALQVNQIIINDGSAFFADKSLLPNFASSIEALNGKISHLSSNSDKPAKVDIQGKIDKYAPVTLKGEVNPLLTQPYLDLDFDFKNVELTSVNPYSGTYAGYYIDQGQLSLALNYQLQNNQLNGSNHLVVNQLELGKPSDSKLATSLPISLAIALLQDRHGVIDLGLEVSGDLDSPSFSFGSIIMTAFTNVITKAVTAPFSLLAGLVGSDDELNKVSFAPGNYAITKSESKNLGKLATALSDRPKLKLSIKGHVDSQQDSQAIKQQHLMLKLASASNLTPDTVVLGLSASEVASDPRFLNTLPVLYKTELTKDPQQVKQHIIEQHQQQSDNAKPLTEQEIDSRWRIALYNFILNQQTASEADLGDLAHQRAMAVKAYLVEVSGVPPSNVFIVDSKIDLQKSESIAELTLGAD